MNDKKRESEKDVSDSDSDGFGPSLPQAADGRPKKRRRKLPFEKHYIEALPAGVSYSKSLMHKDQLAFVNFTTHTDFLITSSVDGVVKFWKKTTGGVEFVKEYKAHEGEIRSVSVSANGRNYATSGVDGTIKVFDVMTYDILAILQPENATPKCICYVHGHGSSDPVLAVSNSTDGTISLYDENQRLIDTVKLHRQPVHLMAYNSTYDSVVSIDEGGMVEYWQPTEPFEKPSGVFEIKSSTDLFAFKKAKSVPCSITISPNGKLFATYSFPDRKIRVFHFANAKLHRTYDESIATITEMHQAGTLSTEPMEAVAFGRKLAVERELENVKSRINVIFDESSNFVLYGSILGVKVIDLLTSRLIKLYGREDPLRPLNLAVFEGRPEKKDIMTVQMAASDNPLLATAEARDSMLGKVRFYMFTNETAPSKANRDVHNEKTKNLVVTKQAVPEQNRRTANAATIHTTLGDISIRLYPQHAPKAVENFTVHSKNGYYNNVIFHRVIRKFMIQTGDPLGNGTGGESIWGKDFEDEFAPELRHDKPYMVSMANAGPRTNASQFFITTDKAPWLDNKHTIFGRVTKGMEVVHVIENVKVRKEKPEEDIKIVSISVDE
ncbi:peptidyl-prolyl cis-trans isomerase cypE [Piedraia hortae CBS 480.64]|uniref:Peptidyl-prolyl cis-trans isomerase-like 1 n=1 Tax=Piedraia hortae CBS 480.64 TaxID=1314780 RepID=A0A6A7C8H9_9PEZI|nr:peptidyl-prolyl cis-trans isomerase cypE [Piedraia hortae CBS 480.64]